jgi:ATP synthase F1 epsilon subunit
MNTIHVDVVSAEESIFSGEAKFVALPGEAGELGIYPRHTPLISRIKAGSVRIEKADGTEEFIFVAGGILEVQPNCVTVCVVKIWTKRKPIWPKRQPKKRSKTLKANLILPKHSPSCTPLRLRLRLCANSAKINKLNLRHSELKRSEF